MNYCIGCLDRLCHLDEDPDGDIDAICVRCRAEEAHDFDKEPNAIFSRSGSRSKHT